MLSLYNLYHHLLIILTINLFLLFLEYNWMWHTFFHIFKSTTGIFKSNILSALLEKLPVSFPKVDCIYVFGPTLYLNHIPNMMNIFLALSYDLAMEKKNNYVYIKRGEEQRLRNSSAQYQQKKYFYIASLLSAKKLLVMNIVDNILEPSYPYFWLNWFCFSLKFSLCENRHKQYFHK